MLFLSTIVFLPLTLAAITSLEKRADAVTCDDVHLFLARGAGESYPGRVGGLADSVCSGLSSCSYENILFTSVQGSLYCTSAAEGAANGVAQVKAYHAACPNSKLVIGGYSLGAQVVGDMLGGGGGNFYNCAEASSDALDASSSPGSSIAAVIMFGNTRHVANEPYNVGTGSGLNGQYPRSGAQLAGLDAYSSRIQDYCFSTDPICALGDQGLTHETYVTVYGATAGAWVKAQLNKKIVAPTSSASSSVSSTTSAASSLTTSAATGSASSTGTFSPFIFSSSSSSVSSAPTTTTGPPYPTATTATGIFTPYTFSATSLPAITASSISALATATAPVQTYATSSVYPTTSTYAYATGSGVASAAPTPSTFVNAGIKATGYSLNLLGLAIAGALIV